MMLGCFWESLGLQGDPTSPFWRRSALGFLWKEWCWSWNSSTLATSWEELTRWKELWCWEGLGSGAEGDDREWEGWMASLARWAWVCVNSGHWWWIGRLGVLRSMRSQRVRDDWATELNSIPQWKLIFSSPMVCFQSNSRKRNAKEYSNYCTTELISHASKVKFKILQERL